MSVHPEIIISKDDWDMILEAMFRIAPENTDKLQQITAGWQFSFEVEHTKVARANFAAFPDLKEVRASQAALCGLWLLAACSFKIMELGMVASRALGKDDPAIADVSLELDEWGFTPRINHARALFSRDLPWPDNVEKPNISNKISDATDPTTNVFLAACSWVLLHEIGHVALSHTTAIPKHEQTQQEYDADKFALSWIIDDCVDKEKRTFRLIGVAVATAWLLLKDAQCDSRGGIHPPSFRRLQELFLPLDLADNDPFYECSGYFLKALFLPTQLMDEAPSAKALFDEVAERLKDEFET